MMSRSSSGVTRLGGAMFVALVAACVRPQDTIRIDGSSGVAPLVKALATEYRARYPSAPLDIASGMGSSARLKALQEGHIDIAMASHGVDSADLDGRGLASRTIARTAVVFAVHADVPVAALSSQQLCDIFAGRIANWRELDGPDRPIMAAMRPRGEVDADVAIEGVPCLRGVTMPKTVRVIERADEMPRVIAETVGGIGLTSAPMVEQSAGRIKSLALDGRSPTVDNVASGAYPLTRQAILVYRKGGSRDVERFLRFVSSADGQRIIRANGAVPSN